MCWNIVTMDKGVIVHEVSTVAEAGDYFGMENVRNNDGSAPYRSETHGYNFCLCPIDVDHLLESKGLVRIPPGDARYDPAHHCVEFPAMRAKCT